MLGESFSVEAKMGPATVGLRTPDDGVGPAIKATPHNRRRTAQSQKHKSFLHLFSYSNNV